MNDSMESMKVQVLNGKLTQLYPEVFLKIHSAKPTEAGMKNSGFDGFATNYIDALNDLYKSPESDLKSNYNNLVEQCLNCHYAHCPGPVKAIVKLRID